MKCCLDQVKVTYYSTVGWGPKGRGVNQVNPSVDGSPCGGGVMFCEACKRRHSSCPPQRSAFYDIFSPQPAVLCCL
jgi:hypothetical protein